MSLAEDLLRFIDAAPTPFHVAENVATTLVEHGWTRLDERDAWPTTPGRYVVVRAGSVVAWSSETSDDPADPFRIVGGHTDSPNLRVKQHHDRRDLDLGVVALEPYGGVLTESWLDRDLGVAGRVIRADGTERLVRVDAPVLRVPRLAIHLDREQEKPNPQRHLNGLWATQSGTFLASVVGENAVAFELMAFDTQPSDLVGIDGDLVAAPRLDNQVTCFAGLRALLDATPVPGVRPVLALFDHEEVGSTSERGADSDLLGTVLERIVLAAGGTREDVHRAVAGSILASGDMAHATHPNHVDKHEPLHLIELGGGPVLKVNKDLRYASEPRGSAAFVRACAQAGVALQRYEHRADLPCGSTIGPISAARVGITTVDVGVPQLAMHSIRETMAAADVDHYTAALTAFLGPTD